MIVQYFVVDSVPVLQALGMGFCYTGTEELYMRCLEVVALRLYYQ